MRKFLIPIMSGLALLTPAAAADAGMRDAWTEAVTIDDLTAACGNRDPRLQAFCLGYIAGLLEFRAAYDNAYRTRQSYCIPPAMTVSDIRRRFLAWAAMNGDKGGAGALWGVSRSMNEIFPC